MNKIKALIIEDELPGRELLKAYLKQIDIIEIVGECENGFDGIKAIHDLKPQLVFLDIQMPKLTGLEMLELLDYKPEIIFTTAYNEYAIKAFEFSAIDYLLKPFSKDRLMSAVDKAVERIGQGTINQDYVNLSASDSKEFLSRIVVKDRGKISIIPCDKVVYLETQDDYVMIHSQAGKFLKQRTMKYYESHLDPQEFVRIHRSYMVRVEEIVEIQPYERDSYIVILKDKVRLKVSKTGYKNLRSVLKF
ncbi:response regulator [Puteibacter caeruleilacunae]|nr:response regulator [Puteibacter caeruleilacunae]